MTHKLKQILPHAGQWHPQCSPSMGLVLIVSTVCKGMGCET